MAVLDRNGKVGLELRGCGGVGSSFLERLAPMIDELGLYVPVVADKTSYFVPETDKPSFDSQTLSDIARHVQGDGKNRKTVATFEGKGYHLNPRLSPDILLQRPLDLGIPHIIVDATDDEDMIHTLDHAVNHGFYTISVNKKPFASKEHDKVHNLLSKAFERQVFLRGTVGADLGAPDTLIEILNERDITDFQVKAVMSGTNGYISTRLQEGVPFSQAIREAMSPEKGLMEPTPYDDIAGKDALRKAIILARAIATKKRIPYEKISIVCSPCLPCRVTEEQARYFSTLKGEEFREQFIREMERFDEPFRRSLEEYGGEAVPRPVASVDYSISEFIENPLRIRVGIEWVSPLSDFGLLRGEDNLFLFYIDGKLYEKVGPGPGAGYETTADAIMNDLEKALSKIRGRPIQIIPQRETSVPLQETMIIGGPESRRTFDYASEGDGATKPYLGQGPDGKNG